MTTFARNHGCVILIPTRERGEMATKLVGRLLLADIPMYVCVPPTDPSLELARYFPHSPLKLIIEKRPGIGRARRTLVEAAHKDGFDYGLMVDDDCWLNYKKMDGFFRRFAASRFTWRGAWNTYYDLMGGKVGLSMCSMVFGLRLQAVVNSGNFDQHLWIQEDGDMMMRLILGNGPKTIGHDKGLLFRHLHTRMSKGGNEHAYQNERAAEHSRYFNKKYGINFTRPKGARVFIDRKQWMAAASKGQLKVAEAAEVSWNGVNLAWYSQRYWKGRSE